MGCSRAAQPSHMSKSRRTASWALVVRVVLGKGGIRDDNKEEEKGFFLWTYPPDHIMYTGIKHARTLNRTPSKLARL